MARPVTPAPPIEKRFWRHAPIGPVDQCWLWSGCRTHGGYGIIRHATLGVQVASRLMFEIFNGEPIPKGYQVCHSCDNPPCVNPAHLWLGTGSDNAQDMISKGRAAWQRKEAANA